MATVRALKPCYCGTPTALREPGDEFEYVGPKASYLELLGGEFVSTAGRPQLDHDKDGKEGGAAAPAPKAPKVGDPERARIIAALKAAKIRFFAGAPTEKLKALLPA